MVALQASLTLLVVAALSYRVPRLMKASRVGSPASLAAVGGNGTVVPRPTLEAERGW